MRVLQQHGGNVEDAGKLLQQAAEALFKTTPQFLRHFYEKIRLQKWRYPAMLAAGEATQKRAYPGNWVQRFIDSDSESFDFGSDYTECRIVKFMVAQNATGLTKYLCQIDFAALESMGLKPERTGTFAGGYERYDFRINRGICWVRSWLYGFNLVSFPGTYRFRLDPKITDPKCAAVEALHCEVL